MQTPLLANTTLHNETMDTNANTNKSWGTRNKGENDGARDNLILLYFYSLILLFLYKCASLCRKHRC